MAVFSASWCVLFQSGFPNPVTYPFTSNLQITNNTHTWIHTKKLTQRLVSDEKTNMSFMAKVRPQSTWLGAGGKGRSSKRSTNAPKNSFFSALVLRLLLRRVSARTTTAPETPIPRRSQSLGLEALSLTSFSALDMVNWWSRREKEIKRVRERREEKVAAVAIVRRLGPKWSLEEGR